MADAAQDRKLNIQNMAMNFLFFMAYCSVIMFAALYMSAKGFAPLIIGLMLGMGNLMAAFLQDLLARWADRPDGPALKSLALGQISIACLTMAPLLVARLPKAYIFFAFLVQTTILISTQTTLYTMTMTYEEMGHRLHFSMIRGVGSIGFAITSLSLGFHVKTAPIDHILWVEALALLATGLVIRSLPVIPKSEGRGAMTDPAEGSPDPAEGLPENSPSLLRQYPVFLGLLVGFSLLFVGHTVINNYMAFVINRVHGDPGHLGIAMMLAALSEMPAMIFYSKIREKRGDVFWIKVSALAFTIKHLILALAVTMAMVFFSQTIQFFSFGLFTPALAYFAAGTVTVREKTRAQGIGIAVQSIGGAMGALFGGAAIQFLGVSATLYLMAALSGLGCAIVFSALQGQKASGFESK